MDERFAGLRKIPREPALRMLAHSGARLGTPLKAPAAACVEDVLEELDAAGAHVDMLRLLSVALPVRECVWWGCLAAEDVLGGRKAPPPLDAARAWVFSPNDENRQRARRAIDTADIDDDTVLCAVAVAMCDGRLGPGELAQYDAPAGGAATAVFGMVLRSMGTATPATLAGHTERLIDCALDIARGGDGRLDARSATAGSAPA